jgi:prephenate dehydrogenase
MRTAVLGLGLVGGSVAQALHPRPVVGFDAAAPVREAAAAWGLPVVDDVAAAVAGADLVVLAAPVAENDRLLAEVPGGCLVTDVGGVKQPVVQTWSALPHPPASYPGHPMAGAETAGWSAARPDLFRGARWVLCPGPWASAEQWLSVAELVLGLGAQVVPADPRRHDEAAAAISHVPHWSPRRWGASAAAAADAGLAGGLAAGSFRDVTRITASPPERTAEFCFANRDATARGLRDVVERLQRSVAALEEADAGRLNALLQDGHTRPQVHERRRAAQAASQHRLELDDAAWADPLVATADAGGVVVAVERTPGGALLELRRPA